MSNLIQRAYPRKIFEVPMQYATPNSGQFRCTQTRNYSAGGLCFETDRQLEPGTEVCVVMDAYAPERSGPESYRS